MVIAYENLWNLCGVSNHPADDGAGKGYIVNLPPLFSLYRYLPVAASGN